MGSFWRLRAASLVVCFITAIVLAVAAAPAAAQGCPELVGRWKYGAGSWSRPSGHPTSAVPRARGCRPLGSGGAGGGRRGRPGTAGEPATSRCPAATPTWLRALVGLQVIDVIGPDGADRGGPCPHPGLRLRGRGLADGYAYVGRLGVSGLRVIDVSDPTAPVEVGFVDTPGFAYAVAVAGGYAYVADDGRGLRVIDVSSTRRRRSRSASSTRPGYAYGVAVAGGYAYVADDDSGLRVIDVSDPTAPVEVGFVDTPGESWQTRARGRLRLRGGRARGSAGDRRLRPDGAGRGRFHRHAGRWAVEVAIVGGYAYRRRRTSAAFG